MQISGNWVSTSVVIVMVSMLVASFGNKQNEAREHRQDAAANLRAQVITGNEMMTDMNASADHLDVTLPEDHNFHNVGHEWLYFSGIVETEGGRTFGLMYTIFQFGNGSIYPVMLAVSDTVSRACHSTRIGTRTTSVKINIHGLPEIHSDNHSINWSSPNHITISSAAKATDGVVIAIDMTMRPTKDVLFHGRNGFISMGDGLPSGYYSLTNLLPTGGTITVGNDSYTAVGGRIWLDHQWGDWTWAGYNWDWFSLRFDDGGALMLFQFRNNAGKVVPGNWTYRDGDGNVTYGTEYELRAHRRYHSYPIDWSIKIPDIEGALKVSPLFDNQTFIGLWEGLCVVTGKIGENRMSGAAFVELNGY